MSIREYHLYRYVGFIRSNKTLSSIPLTIYYIVPGKSQFMDMLRKNKEITIDNITITTTYIYAFENNKLLLTKEQYKDACKKLTQKDEGLKYKKASSITQAIKEHVKEFEELNEHCEYSYIFQNGIIYNESDDKSD